jgi:hypothetical protein
MTATESERPLIMRAHNDFVKSFLPENRTALKQELHRFAEVLLQDIPLLKKEAMALLPKSQPVA